MWDASTPRPFMHVSLAVRIGTISYIRNTKLITIPSHEGHGVQKNDGKLLVLQHNQSNTITLRLLQASNAGSVSLSWNHNIMKYFDKGDADPSILLDNFTVYSTTWSCHKHHLTHWGRVTHICVSKSTIIVSDNGLSPGRRQAIIWTNNGILLIRSLVTNFSEILSEIHTFSFKKMHLKSRLRISGHFVSASMLPW